MIRCLVTLFIFLLATVAHAAPVDSAIHASAVDQHTDLSMSYLGMIFGQVGDVVTGSSGQMFGNLMGIFNKGVMAIAAVILAYNSVFTIIRFTTEGTLMSPNKNTYMILFRVAIGFSLLIPQSTGYSLLQTTMMEVIKYSVKFADNVWSGALDRLNDGATIWHLPQLQTNSMTGSQSTGKDGMFSPKFLQYTLSFTGINKDKITDASKCDATTGYACVLKNGAKGLRGTGGNNQMSLAEAMFLNMICVTSHNVKDKKNEMPSISSDYSSIDYPDGCGKIKVADAVNRLYRNSTDAEKESGKKQVANNLLGEVFLYSAVAKKYVCEHLQSLDSVPPACVGLTKPVINNNIPQWQLNAASAMRTTFLDAGKLASEAKSRSDDSANQGRRNFIPQAKKSGWVMAGAYYWALANLQGAYNEGGRYGNYTIGADIDSSKIKGLRRDAEGVVHDVRDTSAYSLILVQQQASVASKGRTGGTENNPLGAALNGISGLLIILMGPFVALLKSMVSIFTLFSTSGGAMGMGSDPIIWMYRLGQQCLDMSANLYFTGLLANITLIIPFIVCRPLVDALTPTNEAYAWIKVVIIASSVMFLTVGIMLTFFVPMYPFFVFAFGVVGWFVMVVESMVAMPLVALGITHPDGHDILGKAEQALMLMLGVFLRPALMVIGLIASMIVSYVALRFLIWTYSTFLLDLYSPVAATTAKSDGSVLQGALKATSLLMLGGAGSIYGLILKTLITFPILLFIFAGIAYQVVIACYSLIFALPDYVLRWIGGPQQASSVNAAEMAQSMSSNISGFGGQFGGLTRDAGRNLLKSKGSTDRTFSSGGKKDK